MMRYTERPNFTRQQLEDHIMHTLELAAAAALEGADRAALLPAIFDKVCSKQIIAEQFELGAPMAVPRGLG